MFQIDNDDQQKNSGEISYLINQIRSGNKDAYEDIVFQYRDVVYATAWQLTHNSEDAMDVTQEAFVRAYRALGSYKGRSQFGTWLHRIVLNTGIDYIRREKRHRHISTEDLTAGDDQKSDRLPETSVEPTQRSARYERELQKQVLAALDQLSRRQKQVFILRYYHELDIRETAAVLKCTEGSVKRHLFRAQNRLKELMSDLKVPDNGK